MGASLADETWSASVICETSFVLPTDLESFGTTVRGLRPTTGRPAATNSVSRSTRRDAVAAVYHSREQGAQAHDHRRKSHERSGRRCSAEQFRRAAAKQKLALDTLNGFPDQVALALNECPDDAQLVVQMDIYNEINLVVKMCIKDATEIEASLPLIEKKLEEAKAIAEERRAEAGRGRAEEEVEELTALSRMRRRPRRRRS